MFRIVCTSVVCLVVLGMVAGPAIAAGETPTSMPAVSAKVKAKAGESLAAGRKFLLAAQDKEGSWGTKYGPAMTALAVKALAQAGETVDSPVIKRGLDFILSCQIIDGDKLKANPGMKGAFSDKALANYNTAICMSTLVTMNRLLPGKPFEEQIKLGLEFLRRDQWGADQSIDDKNPAFGGFGYGKGARPDMSNTNTTMDALEALKSAGYIDEKDPMFKKVVTFLERSQNREESNKVGTFNVGDDGSFIYTPAVSLTQGGADSKAGKMKLPNGKEGLRGYASMTYAGLKSFVYSGLKRDDARVLAAYNWIRENYRLDENPGLGAKGLFYCYHTMARALAAYGEARITDPANVAHDWRAELVDKLASIQGKDGSWVNNTKDEWEEGNPVLATCFAMLAIEEAVK